MSTLLSRLRHAWQILRGDVVVGAPSHGLKPKTIENAFPNHEVLRYKPALSLEEAIALAESKVARIYDVRSPSEFEEDHIPSSENVPVLDDEERKTVGTLHKVASQVEARRVGAAL